VSGVRFSDIGGRSTRILQQGSGSPLVWLHDTRGNEWSAGHDALSAGWTVVAPSLPGFDDSATLDGIDGPEDVVLWLLDLFESERLERPVMLGCGLGGWMATEFAVRYANRLRALVLVDAYGLHVDGALAADEFALTPPMLRPLLFADGTSELAFSTVPDSEPPERLERALHARVAAARLAWQFPYSRKLRGRLHRVHMPTLVVWGEHDRLVPSAHARAYVDGLPDARLALLQDTGHYPYIERPGAFSEAVREFLLQP
jgi:pimeloyl-ACP methyl ester carboxylesterase